jgi:hypothetical protein
MSRLDKNVHLSEYRTCDECGGGDRATVCFYAWYESGSYNCSTTHNVCAECLRKALAIIETAEKRQVQLTTDAAGIPLCGRATDGGTACRRPEGHGGRCW